MDIKFKMTVSLRAFLLVAFPLVCQLLFVTALVALLWNLQSCVVRQFESREIIADLQHVVLKCAEAAGLKSAVTHLADPAYVDSELNYARSEADKLCLRLEKYPDHVRQAAEFKAAVNKLFAEAEEVEQGRRHGGDSDALMTKLYGAITNVQEVAAKIIATEKGNGQANPARSHQLRSYITLCLGIALASSVLMAVFLGYLYAIGITKPLRQITQNSRLLSQGKPLLPRLRGKDELSELDRMFHLVADELNRALASERAMIDNAADLICSLDQEGRFTSANPFAKRMLGMEPEILISKSLFDVVLPEDSLLADDRLRQSVAGQDMHDFELRLVAADGHILDTRWSCFWSDTEKRLFCVVRDVTEQKKVERLKEDFVGMISHDLRTPLSSLFGSLKLVVAGAKGPVSPEIGAEVGTAAKNVERLVMFVNDLLDFQKLKAGRMQLEVSVFDLSGVISESVDLVKSVADEKNVKIIEPIGQWQIGADRQKLVQTMLNLLGNAIKFTTEGSRVTVSVVENDETVEIGVSDCGPGVPNEYKETIFDAFEQVPSLSKGKQGTGLGLAICKLIVEAHGGSIGVRDVLVGEGASSAGSAPNKDVAEKAVEKASVEKASVEKVHEEKLFNENAAVEKPPGTEHDTVRRVIGSTFWFSIPRKVEASHGSLLQSLSTLHTAVSHRTPQ